MFDPRLKLAANVSSWVSRRFRGVEATLGSHSSASVKEAPARPMRLLPLHCLKIHGRFLRCANSLTQDCAVWRQTVQINIHRVASEKPGAQNCENLRKNSLGNYKTTALPTELCRHLPIKTDPRPKHFMSATGKLSHATCVGKCGLCSSSRAGSKIDLSGIGPQRKVLNRPRVVRHSCATEGEDLGRSNTDRECAGPRVVNNSIDFHVRREGKGGCIGSRKSCGIQRTVWNSCWSPIGSCVPTAIRWIQFPRSTIGLGRGVRYEQEQSAQEQGGQWVARRGHRVPWGRGERRGFRSTEETARLASFRIDFRLKKPQFWASF